MPAAGVAAKPSHPLRRLVSVKPAPRLFTASALAAGPLALGAAAAHYLGTVLRLKPGDEVTLFNGRDGEWRARLLGITRGAVALALEAQQRAQASESDLWLLFAPIKRGPLDSLVEKATELGASRLQPVLTARTNVERVNLDRLTAIAREAAEQSERLTLPEILPPRPLLEALADWPGERRLFICDESGRAPPIARTLAGIAPGPAAVLTGPEGGFAESELDALRKLPILTAVGLGPRVLRSDTAALAGLAVVQALIGDWNVARERPPGAPARPTP